MKQTKNEQLINKDRRWINRRTFLNSVVGSALLNGATSASATSERPNFVIILTDNMGYGDLACYGSSINRTPQIDRMAREGTRFTDFYSSSGVCTPSRASLMTGCYAQRVDMHISDKNGWVLQPVAAKGLNPNETTIAEILKNWIMPQRALANGTWETNPNFFLPGKDSTVFMVSLIVKICIHGQAEIGLPCPCCGMKK